MLPIDKGIWELQNSCPDSQSNSWPESIMTGGVVLAGDGESINGALVNLKYQPDILSSKERPGMYIHSLPRYCVLYDAATGAPWGGSRGRWSQQSAWI